MESAYATRLKWGVATAATIVLLAGVSARANEILSGAGATFPAPLYVDWFEQYARVSGQRVLYDKVGSGQGVQKLMDREVDFGATDAFITDDDLAFAPAPVLHLEPVPGALAEGWDRLASGQIDLFVAAPYTGEMAESFAFSQETVISTWAQIYIPRGVGLQTMMALDGRAVAVVRDDPYLLEVEPRPLRLSPVVKEALRFLRAALPSTVEVRYRIDDESATVLADPVQVHQVLMNLCTNAVHAMSEHGGVLDVAVSTVDGQPSGTGEKTVRFPSGRTLC